MRNYPELDWNTLNKSFSPIWSENIRELVEGRKSAAMVVDDLTRPKPAHPILPPSVGEITRAGTFIRRVYIIGGVGLYRSLTRENIINKVAQNIVEN